MNALQSVGLTICYTCAAISILSVLIPQKRTRRIMNFVIGIFFIGTLITAVSSGFESFDFDTSSVQSIEIPDYTEEDYTAAVAQMTADNATAAIRDLLYNEGIEADDIQLTLKISDEGRISVVRAVIYISEAYRDREADVESIIYRNLSKEPEIYVTGEEARRVAER